VKREGNKLQITYQTTMKEHKPKFLAIWFPIDFFETIHTKKPTVGPRSFCVDELETKSAKRRSRIRNEVIQYFLAERLQGRVF
jgi:hypothetical protein